MCPRSANLRGSVRIVCHQCSVGRRSSRPRVLRQREAFPIPKREQQNKRPIKARLYGRIRSASGVVVKDYGVFTVPDTFRACNVCVQYRVKLLSRKEAPPADDPTGQVQR